MDFVAELQFGGSWEDVPLEFHRLSINSVQSSVFRRTFEPRQSVFPCNVWLKVLVHLSKTQYRIWEYEDHYSKWLMTSSSPIKIKDKYFHGVRINCFYSKDLIWLFGYQFLRYVEHPFHCEIFCLFDGMPILWRILLHEYKMFVALLSCIFCGLCLPFSHMIIHPVQEKNDLDPHDNSDSAWEPL